MCASAVIDRRTRCSPHSSSVLTTAIRRSRHRGILIYFLTIRQSRFKMSRKPGVQVKCLARCDEYLRSHHEPIDGAQSHAIRMIARRISDGRDSEERPSCRGDRRWAWRAGPIAEPAGRSIRAGSCRCRVPDVRDRSRPSVNWTSSGRPRLRSSFRRTRPRTGRVC